MTHPSGHAHEGALGGSPAEHPELRRPPPSACRRSYDQPRRRKCRQIIG